MCGLNQQTRSSESVPRDAVRAVTQGQDPGGGPGLRPLRPIAQRPRDLEPRSPRLMTTLTPQS